MATPTTAELAGMFFSAIEDPQAAGDLGWIRDGGIRCPWHQWEFNIMTDETLSTPARADPRGGTESLLVVTR